jgi:type I restriction enzyme, R subunit
MAKTYLEQDFEEHIEEYLLSSGYIKRSPADYDRDLCLIPDEVITFIRDTQPEEYEKIERQYGTDTDKKPQPSHNCIDIL